MRTRASRPPQPQPHHQPHTAPSATHDPFAVET